MLYCKSIYFINIVYPTFDLILQSPLYVNIYKYINIFHLQAYIIHEDQRLSVNSQFLQTCKEDTGTSEVNKRQTKVKSFVDNVTSSECRKIVKLYCIFLLPLNWISRKWNQYILRIF